MDVCYPVSFSNKKYIRVKKKKLLENMKEKNISVIRE